MKKPLLALGLVALFTIGLGSCSSDDDSNATPAPPTADLSVKIVGLETLTADAKYEGWIIVDDKPVSTGKFSSTSADQTFKVDEAQLKNATQFVLTVEPPGDTDDVPSDFKLLSGDFNGTTAQVNVKEMIGDFSSVSGKFIMATPTDTTTDNDQNGIWFMDPSGSTTIAGLTLPALKQGWKYEGWVIIKDKPVSTGTFSTVSGVDDSSPYSGNQMSPAFPGEDFLSNAPTPLSFPEDGDVREKDVVISVEPDPDYDKATPFFFKPLKGKAGQDLAPTLNTLAPNGTGPFGSVVRP